MSSNHPRYDNQRPIISWDTETERFARGYMAPRIACHAFAWRSGSHVETALLAREEGFAELHGILDRCIAGEVTIAAHYMPYDVLCAGAADEELLFKFFDAYEAGGVHCTQVAEWVNDAARGLLRVEWNDEKNEYTSNKLYNLENLMRVHFGWPPYKDEWRLRYGELLDTPIALYPEAAQIYPKKDAQGTMLLAESQRDIAAQISPHDPLVATLAHHCRTYLALALTSAWGEEIDADRVTRLNAAVDRYREEFIPDLLKAKLITQTMRGKNAGKLTKKKKRLQEMVADDLILRGVFDCTAEDILTRPMDVLLNEKGQPDDDYLTEGGKSGNRVLKVGSEILVDCTQENEDGSASILNVMHSFLDAEKLRTSFGAPLVKFGYGPTHSRYGFAETARTTCSGGPKRDRMGLNVQQLPRDLPRPLKALMMEILGEIIDIRSCFVPRAGWVQSSSDFSALEMRTLAQACIWLVGHSTLADALNQKVDPHTLFAANFFLHTDYDAAIARVKAEEPLALAMRQRAKVGNFGLPGGMGAKKFFKYAKKQGVVLTMEECFFLKKAFPKQWTEIVSYFAYCSDVTQSGSATIVGLSSGHVRGDCRYTDTCNGFFQEQAAALATDALWVNVRECYDRRLNTALFGSRMTAFIHDEYRAEHPIEVAHEAATRLADNAREVQGRWLPDVEPDIEPALMDRWYKSAKTVRDDGGRLQVWQPKQKEAG